MQSSLDNVDTVLEQSSREKRNTSVIAAQSRLVSRAPTRRPSARHRETDQSRVPRRPDLQPATGLVVGAAISAGLWFVISLVMWIF